MKQPDMPVVLASSSPRRRELMENLDLAFTVDVSEADETFSGRPEEMAPALAERKAHAVAGRHPSAKMAMISRPPDDVRSEEPHV